MLSVFLIRQRPTLPGGHPPGTIGAGRLNFCVRNGNRCDPFAIAAGFLRNHKLVTNEAFFSNITVLMESSVPCSNEGCTFKTAQCLFC